MLCIYTIFWGKCMRKWNVFLALVLVLSLLVPAGALGAESRAVAPAYLVLEDDTSVSWTLQQDLYIDLNGNYLTGTIETNGYKVYGMDAFTDSYYADDAGRFLCKDASGKRIVPEAYVKTDLSGQTKWYMTVDEGSAYSFHRIYLGITHTTLAPAVTGVGFKAQFRGDEEVCSRVASLGYQLWLEDGKPVEKTVSDFRENLTLLLKNIPPETYGQTTVYARVQMTMTDGMVLESSTSTLTLRDLVESVNARYYDFTAEQRNAVWAMVQQNPIMQTWSVGNLQLGSLDENMVYHLRMVQNMTGKTLYMAGGLNGEYWATTTDAYAAAEVYVEAVEGGYRFYYYDTYGVKTYIQAYLKSASSSRPQAATTPTQVWSYYEDAGVYTVTMNGTRYYMGTYNQFETIGVSNIKYITGSNAANVGVSQFIAEFIPAGDREEDPGDEETPCSKHVDADNNGRCDICKYNVTIIIDLYAVNDLHGKLADGDSHPGVDELSTYFANAKASRDNVILLSSGDMWQGAAESNLTQGLILTDWMNQMGFVSMTIGNHEFDWGQEIIRLNEEFAQFPFLAINIFDKNTNAQVDFCQSSVVVEADGLQIGIIGAVGDCYSSISSDRSSGVTFKTGSALTNLIKNESDRLRNAGVDFVVLSIHDGGSSGSDLSHYDTALSNGYVDLVFEAHTHQSYVQRDSYGVYHVQGGGDNTGISQAIVTYNTLNDTFGVTARTLDASSYSYLDDHPVVEDLLEQYADEVAYAYEVLGSNRVKRTSSTIKQKVAELYCQTGVERWGEKYNIVLGGGFLSTRSPHDLAAGQVTYGKLLDILPFDNRLVLCKITGANLKSKFINTSNQNYVISFSDYGDQIKNSIQNNTYYYVLVDTYTAYYSSNNLTIVEFYDDNVYARDLLAKYIQEGNWS